MWEVLTIQKVSATVNCKIQIKVLDLSLSNIFDSPVTVTVLGKTNHTLAEKAGLTIKHWWCSLITRTCKTNWGPNLFHMDCRPSLWVIVGVDGRGMGGGGCTVCRVCSVAAVACSCDIVQMCGKTQAPADLASSWKANASSEVGPAFEVLECWSGYHRSESPCSVGKPALNLPRLCCSAASETD